MLDNEELYVVLNNLESEEGKNILSKLGACEDNPQFRLGENLKKFVLLKKISTLSESFEKGFPKFNPMIEFTDGRRSFSVEDMTDEDFDTLSELDLVHLPIQLGVRVADLLWFRRKDRKAAQFSIESYYNLYLSTFDYDNWVNCVEYIRRAITFSQKLNDKTNRNKYLKDIFDKLIEGKGTDKNYFSIVVAEFLIEQNWDNLKPILSVMDNIIKTTSDIRKAERAFEIKRNIYKRQKDEESVHSTDCEHAEYLEQVSKRWLNDDFQGLIQSEQCLKKAVILYRVGNNHNAAEVAHRKLLSVQSRIAKEIPMLVEKFDVSDFYNHTIDFFEGLTFEEHILRLALICKIFTKDEIKESVYDPERFFSRRFFDKQVKDKNGRTVCEISALGENSSPEDEQYQMHFDLLQKECVYGDNALKWAVQLLNEHFDYSENDLEFIVKDNWIIPNGRKRIFQKALYWGLKGELYSALHILAPQVENLFRNIALELGSNMSTLNTQGVAEDKLLSSVFDDPLLNECYDEDILFTFKGLMNEKAGGNYRNKIAHGIIEEKECKEGSALYFLCATIKVLLLTSRSMGETVNKYLKGYIDVCNNELNESDKPLD